MVSSGQPNSHRIKSHKSNIDKFVDIDMNFNMLANKNLGQRLISENHFRIHSWIHL